MLVLKRRKEEEIIIDRRIIIKVVEIQGGSSVNLGIDAPRDIEVHRGEVLAKIQKEEAERGQKRQDELRGGI